MDTLKFFKRYMNYQIAVLRILKETFSESEMPELVERYAYLMRKGFENDIPFDLLAKEILYYEYNAIYS